MRIDGQHRWRAPCAAVAANWWSSERLPIQAILAALDATEASRRTAN